MPMEKRGGGWSAKGPGISELFFLNGRWEVGRTLATYILHPLAQALESWVLPLSAYDKDTVVYVRGTRQLFVHAPIKPPSGPNWTTVFRQPGSVRVGPSR